MTTTGNSVRRQLAALLQQCAMSLTLRARSVAIRDEAAMILETSEALVRKQSRKNFTVLNWEADRAA